MTTEIISIITGVCAVGALIWNGIVFSKEQKNVRVKLLADFIARATDLLDKQKDVLSAYLEEHPQAFSELERLYQKLKSA